MHIQFIPFFLSKHFTLFESSLVNGKSFTGNFERYKELRRNDLSAIPNAIRCEV